MAGREPAALSGRLSEGGGPAPEPAAVESRAGWPDQMGSDHTVGTLAQAALLHSGRPTVVTVGVGAQAVVCAGRVGVEGPAAVERPSATDMPRARPGLGPPAAESALAAP